MALNLRTLKLRSGSHDARAKGLCALEAVAWLANEEHSDHPQCACPVVSAFVRRLNDRMPDDATRTKRLRPLLRQIVGTRATPEIEIKRAYIAADFAAREALPLALDARGKKEDAAKLRALDPITDKSSAAAASASYASYAAASCAAAASASYASYAAAASASYAAAASASYAAAAAADAASYAAADAASYASAASASYASYAAAAARSPVWLAAVGCIKRMCAVTA